MKMSSSMVLAMAALGASALGPSGLAAANDMVRHEPMFHPKNTGIRFLTCEICHNGGGTLVNYGSKTRKAHKRCIP